MVKNLLNGVMPYNLKKRLAAKVPPTISLEQRQGNPKMIRDHLVEGVTGRWNGSKNICPRSKLAE